MITNNPCEESRDGNGLIILFFLMGYIFYQIFGEIFIKENPEERERKIKKCEKYFEKHRKENEEFFFGEYATTG